LDGVLTASRVVSRPIRVVNAGGESAIDAAFAAHASEQVGALMVGASSIFISLRDRVVELAARHRIPAIYENREFAEAGGLMSYGPSNTDAYRQVGVYAGRILKGEKPADLPVLLPTRFEFVINLKTAKTLGLTIPPGILAIADAVIE
jgi:putative ABC transport system substrate-binding protein